MHCCNDVKLSKLTAVPSPTLRRPTAQSRHFTHKECGQLTCVPGCVPGGMGRNNTTAHVARASSRLVALNRVVASNIFLRMGQEGRAETARSLRHGYTRRVVSAPEAGGARKAQRRQPAQRRRAVHLASLSRPHFWFIVSAGASPGRCSSISLSPSRENVQSSVFCTVCTAHRAANRLQAVRSTLPSPRCPRPRMTLQCVCVSLYTTSLIRLLSFLALSISRSLSLSLGALSLFLSLSELSLSFSLF